MVLDILWPSLQHGGFISTPHPRLVAPSRLASVPFPAKLRASAQDDPLFYSFSFQRTKAFALGSYRPTKRGSANISSSSEMTGIIWYWVVVSWGDQHPVVLGSRQLFRRGFSGTGEMMQTWWYRIVIGGEDGIHLVLSSHQVGWWESSCTMWSDGEPLVLGVIRWGIGVVRYWVTSGEMIGILWYWTLMSRKDGYSLVLSGYQLRWWGFLVQDGHQMRRRGPPGTG